MQLNQIGKLFAVQAHNALMSSGEQPTLNIYVLHSESVGGFVLRVDMSGKECFWVSSQRQERRVFKTLDAIRRATRAAGISSFTVIC